MKQISGLFEVKKVGEKLFINYEHFLKYDKEKDKEIERLNEKIEKLHKENIKYIEIGEEFEKRIDKAIEYIEYYFAKGRTKNHKQFDLSLYEILTGKNLFNLTMKEIEQFFKGVDKE